MKNSVPRGRGAALLPVLAAILALAPAWAEETPLFKIPPKYLEPDPELTGTAGRILSPEAEDLVRVGILYHDQGDYESAMGYYREALALSPDHPVICYEMAFSSLYMGDFQGALELADQGITAAKARGMDDLIPNLFDLKGSALDNLGRGEEAIEVYLSAINVYGAANTFLYYNLGLSYYRIEKRDEARNALIEGLLINPNHASGNYLLGRLCMEKGMKTQGFYAFAYFLLLEPNTERAEEAYTAILAALTGQDETAGLQDNGSFTGADRVISLSFTLDEENKDKSDAEKTQAKLYHVFDTLGGQNDAEGTGYPAGDALWRDFYIPFFFKIAHSDYFGIFCRYIGLTADPGADEWIENGREEIEGFFGWLNGSLD
ncbi:MAG: tetratricopeptide repeat protein [Treponema sp.]|nr:tetratricopeptide repeat protein [Treponema sp.]